MEVSLFEVKEGESFWDVIPEEIACRITSELTNFQDILKYMISSSRFRDLAKRCIKIIDSPVKKIQVDLRLLEGFSMLEVVSDNVVIVVTPQTLPLISTLLVLRQANFHLSDLSQMVFPLLAQLKNGTSLRIWDDRRALYIQRGQFMVIPHAEDVTQGILQNYPHLQYMNLSTLRVGFGQNYIMSTPLRKFLMEADWGLVYPNQPPSEANPELSLYIHQLGISGLARMPLLRDIFVLYAHHHGLIRKFTIYPDQTMTKYFLPIVERRNQAGYNKVNWDGMSLTQLNDLISGITYFGMRPQYPEEYDIPVAMDPQILKKIEIVVLIALPIYWDNYHARNY